jgi:hypothetical protein
VNHVAGASTKGDKLRVIVREEFKKNMNEADPAKVEMLKGGAVRALASYLMIESSSQDTRLNESSKAYLKREAAAMCKGQDEKSG